MMRAVIFRCAGICFFLFSEVCCQPFRQDFPAAQRFGFYSFREKNPASASVTDFGSVKGGGVAASSMASMNPVVSHPSSNAAMEVPPNRMWMQSVPASPYSSSQANPEWPPLKPAGDEPNQSTMPLAQVTQVEVTQSPVQMPQKEPEQLPAQVNQVQRPSGSASVTDYGSVNGSFSTFSEVSRNPVVSHPSAQENQSPPNQANWVWMQPGPVSQSSSSQANPERPPPRPSQGESNQLQSVSQVVKVHSTVPPVQVTEGVKLTKAPVLVPQEKPEQSPAQVSTEQPPTPHLTPNPTGGSEGASSGRERYLVISSPSGFQTRYIVKSYNRFVRGKKIYSQTTYIPLNFVKPASAPAPCPQCSWT